MLGALLDQTVIAGVEKTYQFDPAVDPDAGDDLNLVYSATQANGSARPEGVGFDADRLVRTFTFAATLTAQTVTLRVTASDGSLRSQPRDFVLRVRSGGAIVANTSGLAALSRTTRQASFGVRLEAAGEGGDAHPGKPGCERGCGGAGHHGIRPQQLER